MLFLTIFSSLGPVSANEFVEPNVIVSTPLTVDSELNLTESELEFEMIAQSTGTPVVWRKNILARVVGGVIIYVTGKSLDDWVAAGLKRMEPQIKQMARDWTKPIYVNHYGTAVTRCAPTDTCPIAPFSLDNDEE